MTHDPREALEPCPFCGGNAQIVEGEESAYVQCLDVKMHRALWFTGDNNAANEVAEQWNTRALTASPGEQKPVALAHVRLEDDGLFADLQVLDGTNLQPSMSPIALYLSPPPSTGWDEEYPFDDERFNKGVQHVVDLIARELGVTDWIAGDGSEDYDCDLWQTILNILSAKGLYDKDEGEFKALRREAPAPEEVAGNYSKDIERKMMEVADLIAATLDQPLDPRAWDHLLIYAPREALDRRLSTLNHGENHDAVLASYRPDDEVRERHVDRGRPEPRNANQVANEQSGNAPVRMEVLGGGNQGIGHPDAAVESNASAESDGTMCPHPIETLWRKVGLPEFFLGNGGTNHKLYDLYDAIRSTESNASVEARLREAVNDMLGAFAEGVCWSPEQRAAYEKAAKLVSPAGGDGPDSDCATHNEPTYPNGPCNYSGPCGWKDEANESRRDDLALAAKCAGKLCDDCPPVGYETDRTRCLPCPRRTVGDEAKKSDEAAGTRPVPSVSGNSDREQQRDTTGVTAGETATPSDPTAERREIVVRINKLARSAFNEGFQQGMREETSRRGGKTWDEFKTKYEAAIIAALYGGAGRSTQSEEKK